MIVNCKIFIVLFIFLLFFFFFSSRRRHTRWNCDWSSDVCSSDLCWSWTKREILPVIRTVSPISNNKSVVTGTIRASLFGRLAMRNPAKGRMRRSEERRVGKECRYRWARDHEKKKVRNKVRDREEE